MSVWLFLNEAGAQRAVHRLGQGTAPKSRLEDAAIVSWLPDEPRPRAWQVTDAGCYDAFAGAFWGLLVGLLLLLPLSEDHAGPPRSQAPPWEGGLARLGISSDFADAVRRHVVPGTSALFTVTSTTTHELPASNLPKDALEVARAELTAEQLGRLHAGFDN